ncbi:hypothetical protein LZ32DRAFT_240855 [Colletotrichum eremochloae]|nr:hypothetical protein LZ32DRAFT_240855 [Colletotrichum eremochloae]
MEKKKKKKKTNNNNNAAMGRPEAALVGRLKCKVDNVVFRPAFPTKNGVMSLLLFLFLFLAFLFYFYSFLSFLSSLRSGQHWIPQSSLESSVLVSGWRVVSCQSKTRLLSYVISFTVRRDQAAKVATPCRGAAG